jgi:ATP-binding cassette subfamily C protein
MRLMGCVNRIVTGLASSRHGTASLRSVFGDLAASQQALPPAKLASGETLDLKRFIEFREVRFRHAGADRMSLDGVSATVPAKSTVALVGHSGAGKTTLVDLLLGLHKAESGEILIDGQPLQEVLPAWQRSVGYIPQSVFLLDDTIRRNVAFGVEDKAISDERVWAALKVARLEGFVRSAERGLDTIIGERGARLSGGEQQRVGIARALYHDPPVLVLDEATAALDNATEREFQEALAAVSAGKTVIVIAHRLSTVKRASRILLFAHGKILASGTYAELASAVGEFQRLVSAGEFESATQAAAQ